jgi:predicted enzyme related to lactoylglutathione lyase
MRRVTGIGGIFFKARNAEVLREWYRRHLGIAVQEWGGATFRWHDPLAPESNGATVWSIFKDSSDYFAPSTSPFMINYRVADLAAILDTLRAEGCAVDERMESSEFGKFGWVMDPEGNRIELWEPPAERFPG